MLSRFLHWKRGLKLLLTRTLTTVNIYEKEMKREQIESIRKNIFKTKTGLEFLDRMFLYLGQ